MYVVDPREDVIRIPPHLLGRPLQEVAEELARTTFEGKMDGERGYTVLVKNVQPVGEGRIVHGDGAVYQKLRFEALVFRPTLHEIVDGTIVEVMKFGAFVRFGALDGLLHVSQIMDDRIDIDVDNQRLLGKDTRRDLRVGDSVRARIVSLSINERSPKESKIGLTMRQPGLGKHQWIEEDRKKREEREAKQR